MANYSISNTFTVWNDNTGESIVVKEDSDGRGLMELLSEDSNGKVEGRLTIPTGQAIVLIKAMNKWLEMIEK